MQMRSPLKSRHATKAAVLALAIAIAGGSLFIRVSTRSAASRSTAGELLVGARFADSLQRALSRTGGDSSAVLAALYLERARLGFGSPFRLVDYALRDSKLRPAHRRLVANAILARTQQGLIYSTPPEALNLISPSGRHSGLAHRDFIEKTTSRAADPRAAELALRLAYQIGASSGVVSHRAAAITVSAIAQARDRALAMRDVDELLERARRQQLDPVDLVPVWRATRQFAVERPLVEPASAAQDRIASLLLPSLVGGLDSLQAESEPGARDRSLGMEASATAVSVAARRNAPPQAPVIVTLGGFSSYVTGGAPTASSRAARAAFLAESRTEETMAAAYARLRAVEGLSTEAGVGILAAAVALRPYGQERTWLPGDGGPSLLDLQGRLGLASLTFDAKVPVAWRPYYTRMLDDVVRDMRLVFPRFDLSGLHVRFGESPLKERALALHDPATRTVYFPLGTSAGAMAHEFSHDLDWQAARKRYGSTTAYRTDRSVRQYRDGLSATLGRMASSSRGDRSATSPDRPTETFARGADWIIASSLAQRGILNGYLTAVQDEVLTGYASATAPRRDATRADATMLALSEIADVDHDLLGWYEGTYGLDRKADIADGVRRALTAPLPRLDSRGAGPGMFDVFRPAQLILGASADVSGAWDCLLHAPSLKTSDRDAMRRAMQVAAEARVHGVVNRWSDFSERSRTNWRFRMLGGAPWDPEGRASLEREMRDALLWRAARVDDGKAGVDLVERAEREAAWTACAAGA
jgi:hypothetical protein